MRLLKIACKYIEDTLLSFTPNLIVFIIISGIGALAYLIIDVTVGQANLAAIMIGAWSILFLDEFSSLISFLPQIARFIIFSGIGALMYLIIDATIGQANLTAIMIGACSVLVIDEFIRLLVTRGRKK